MRTNRTKRQDVYLDKDTAVLHIETPHAIINIRVWLQDNYGHSVESVQIIPDSVAGEPPTWTDGGVRNVRVVHALTLDEKPPVGLA